MDLNLVVLGGRLAAPPEIRSEDGGTRMVRYLVATRSERPDRRVDVIPVTSWESASNGAPRESTPGRRIWIAGSIQRRFWDIEVGRRSRLEVVAHQVEIRAGEEATAE